MPGVVPGIHVIRRTTEQARTAGASTAMTDSAFASSTRPGTTSLALQLPFMQFSESMGDHDSKIVDAASVD
jgi:hypothetical protein